MLGAGGKQNSLRSLHNGKPKETMSNFGYGKTQSQSQRKIQINQ